MSPTAFPFVTVKLIIFSSTGRGPLRAPSPDRTPGEGVPTYRLGMWRRKGKVPTGEFCQWTHLVPTFPNRESVTVTYDPRFYTHVSPVVRTWGVRCVFVTSLQGGLSVVVRNCTSRGSCEGSPSDVVRNPRLEGRGRRRPLVWLKAEVGTLRSNTLQLSPSSCAEVPSLNTHYEKEVRGA